MLKFTLVTSDCVNVVAWKSGCRPSIALRIRKHQRFPPFLDCWQQCACLPSCLAILVVDNSSSAKVSLAGVTAHQERPQLEC